MSVFSAKQKQAPQRTSSDTARPKVLAHSVGHQEHPILNLQRTIGNQAVLRLLQAGPQPDAAGSSSEAGAAAGHLGFIYNFASIPVFHTPVRGIQRKLTINMPGDAYEQEADRVAEQVMRMPEPSANVPGVTTPHTVFGGVAGVQRACACSGTCDDCKKKHPEDEHARVQMKAAGQAAMGGIEAPPIVHEVLRSPGQPLDAQARAFMEPRFGYDFSKVRVHTDERAAESAIAMQARAYTAGWDIAFGAGQFAPASAEGRRLVAHELAHVVQHQSQPLFDSPERVRRQVYGPAILTGAGADLDSYFLQFEALESAAIADGYSLDDRITAFRKLYYDSSSSAQTYAGAVVGGGVWNILIPGAANTKLPPSWSHPAWKGAIKYLRSKQVLSINGKSTDIGHTLAGVDAAKHPAPVNLAAGTIKLRSNVEAATFIGDLGSVVTEYIHDSTASLRDTAMVRSPILDTYYNRYTSLADSAGNADAQAMTLDNSKTLAENLRLYYAATLGGVKKRFTAFASKIGLGILTGTTFSGDTPAWRKAMLQEVFNSALAYASGKGWKSDVLNVFANPRPGIFAATFWEMYWNNSEWVVDIFVNHIVKEVSKE